MSFILPDYLTSWARNKRLLLVSPHELLHLIFSESVTVLKHYFEGKGLSHFDKKRKGWIVPLLDFLRYYEQDLTHIKFDMISVLFTKVFKKKKFIFLSNKHFYLEPGSNSFRSRLVSYNELPIDKFINVICRSTALLCNRSGCRNPKQKQTRLYKAAKLYLDYYYDEDNCTTVDDEIPKTDIAISPDYVLECLKFMFDKASGVASLLAIDYLHLTVQGFFMGMQSKKYPRIIINKVICSNPTRDGVGKLLLAARVEYCRSLGIEYIFAQAANGLALNGEIQASLFERFGARTFGNDSSSNLAAVALGLDKTIAVEILNNNESLRGKILSHMFIFLPIYTAVSEVSSSCLEKVLNSSGHSCAYEGIAGLSLTKTLGKVSNLLPQTPKRLLNNIIRLGKYLRSNPNGTQKIQSDIELMKERLKKPLLNNLHNL